MVAFLDRYTLHDSYWIGLFTECAWQDSSVLVLRFDPVWNSSVSAQTSAVANWPLLFLRLNCVTSIHLGGFRNVGGTQRGIGEATCTLSSEEEAVTTIDDFYGGSVRLHHFPLISALALTDDGTVLPLTA